MPIYRWTFPSEATDEELSASLRAREDWAIRARYPMAWVMTSYGLSEEQHRDPRAPARVFAYVDDPMNLVEWLPGMFDVRNVIGTGAGQQYEWTYKMAGPLLRGQSTVIEHVPDERAVHQNIGMISAIWGYTVEPHQEGRH